MKISTDSQLNKYVYDLRLGNLKVKTIFHGTDKIYPDSSARIHTLRLDIAPWQGTRDALYWEHALEAVSAYSDSSRYIRLTVDRTYQLQSSSGSYPVAVSKGGGLVEFPYGEGPCAQNVRLGDTATLRLRIPSIRSQSIGGNQPDTAPLSRLFPPVLPGTEARAYFTKGQKKVSTGVALTVVNNPGNRTLLQRHQQQDGHCRVSRDWSYGYVASLPGDTQSILRATPHQPRGPWGAYFVYPGFELTLRARIIQLTKES